MSKPNPRPKFIKEIAFGEYKIIHSKGQLSYFYGKETVKVRDVSIQYDSIDFYEHALEVARAYKFRESELRCS